MPQPDVESPTIYTVSSLTSYIKDLIESDAVLRSLWVRGEVSNFVHHGSGHMYFTLKDVTGRLRSVMFRGSASRLRFRPEDGMKVLALGSISVYERSGDYQFYCEHMEPEGKGALFVAFEQLKSKLEQEGLFRPELKRPLPPRPRRVAVLTSPTGAAVRDVITIARRRWPGVWLTVIGTVVQGDAAPASIVDSLRAANQLECLDVVILGRGGGSIEELWAFNDERVARAIAASRVPVVSAVGHETDFTIADFVADMRAPTPSGAAELVIPDVVADRAKVAQLHARLTPALSRGLEAKRQALVRLRMSPALANPVRGLDMRRQGLDVQFAALRRCSEKALAAGRAGLAEAAGRLNSLSPLAVLGRGYAICSATDGRALTDPASIRVGDRVSVRLAHGGLGCVVDEVRGPQTAALKVVRTRATRATARPPAPGLFDEQ